MVKVIGGFGGKFKKRLENTIGEITENAKQRKIAELKRKGLYKPGVTKIVVKINDTGDRWKKSFTKI